MSGADVTKRLAGRMTEAIVTYLGCVVAFAVLVFGAIALALAVALPRGTSVVLPGLVSLDQHRDQLVFELGPAAVLGPVVLALAATPLTLAVRRRVLARQHGIRDAA